MAKFERKGKNSMPAISTASLPDIVFMLLFFFMVSTTLRETEMLVRVKLPEASEVVKLEKKSLVSYIYVGPPARQYQAIFGT
ncbi:MAG: biopolymer transporter ExbD, partial [Bacteroidetes bacterium HGW-Bacteroidetes-15]